MIINQEKKHAKFRVSFIFLIVVLSFAGCFLYYMKSDDTTKLEEDDNASEAVVYVTSEAKETQTGTENKMPAINPVPENNTAGSEYLTDSIFIGDTILSKLSEYGLISSDNILAGENLRLFDINSTEINIDGEKLSCSDAIKKTGASNLYIMLGTDDIASMTNDAMLKEYSSFIKTVIGSNNDKTIYIVSVPPVTDDKENDRTAPILNTAVDSYNTGLLKLADENGVCYLDLNSALKGNDGKLSPEFAGNDGVTLNESGSKKVIDYILTHTYKK